MLNSHPASGAVGGGGAHGGAQRGGGRLRRAGVGSHEQPGEEAMRQYLRERLSPYKVPSEIRVLGSAAGRTHRKNPQKNDTEDLALQSRAASAQTRRTPTALPHCSKTSSRCRWIGSPLFIISNPDLVLAQCLAGVVGSFPALNARPKELLDEWLAHITATLDAARAGRARAPHRALRGQPDHPFLQRPARPRHGPVREAYRVPIVITSLSAPTDYVAPVHAYGGLVFHDVTNVKHAQRHSRPVSTASSCRCARGRAAMPAR